jgi:hypothetical protein
MAASTYPGGYGTGGAEGTDADTRIVLSEVAIGFIPISRLLFDLGQTTEALDEADLYH